MAELDFSVIADGTKEYEKMIKVSEERYQKRINEVADKIVETDMRIILLAGPSASGKTTTAHLISDALRSRGKDSFVVSLDDFYRSREDKEYPRFPDGTPDYETPYALCLDEIRETLVNIADSKDFLLPKFDFKVGARATVLEHKAMPNGCVVVEGLHALNPLITDSLIGKKALKIFVSVSTNINVNGARILSGKRTRFVRRVVRDSIFRASSPERTFSLWNAVVQGEDKYLYPFKNCADLAIDTFHYFELGVLKNMALPILENSSIVNENYVKRVISGLKYFEAIPVESVPASSLIREFISGGIYEELY